LYTVKVSLQTSTSPAVALVQVMGMPALQLATTGLNGCGLLALRESTKAHTASVPSPARSRKRSTRRGSQRQSLDDDEDKVFLLLTGADDGGNRGTSPDGVAGAGVSLARMAWGQRFCIFYLSRLFSLMSFTRGMIQMVLF
jgi:hypothetical protein